MFLGQYSHQLDYKGRLSIPKKFRNELKDSVLTVGLDGCLFLYDQEEWKKLTESLSRLPFTAKDARAFSRYFFSSAVETSFDSLGRITIPDFLLKHAQIKKEALVVGVADRVEIWAKERWELVKKEIDSKSEDIAEKLSESDF